MWCVYVSASVCLCVPISNPVTEQATYTRRRGDIVSLAGPDVRGKGTSRHYCQHSVDCAGMLA